MIFFNINSSVGKYFSIYYNKFTKKIKLKFEFFDNYGIL